MEIIHIQFLQFHAVSINIILRSICVSVTTAVLEVKYDDYRDHFRDQGQFIVCFIADVAGTDFEYIYNENVQIKIPVINIEVLHKF